MKTVNANITDLLPVISFLVDLARHRESEVQEFGHTPQIQAWAKAVATLEAFEQIRLDQIKLKKGV